MYPEVRRKLFTVREYHQMAESGILLEDARVELIRGEIIEMSPLGVRHAACVKRLNAIFAFKFRRKAIVSVQDPIRLGHNSEPEPDLALLRYRDDYYAAFIPTGDDTLLVLEVSDSTLGYDRRLKLPLYAEAQILEVWIVNLVDDLIEVYRQPENGAYQEMFRVYAGDELTAVSFPNTTFDPADLIPS